MHAIEKYKIIYKLIPEIKTFEKVSSFYLNKSVFSVMKIFDIKRLTFIYMKMEVAH